MLKDMYKMLKKTEICVLGKKYYFEFDNVSYSDFEKMTQKSIFEFYDNLTQGKSIMHEYLEAMILCGLKKYHSADEICEFESHLLKNTNLWVEVGNAAKFAFFIPLLPPDLTKKYEGNRLKMLVLKIRNWINSLLKMFGRVFN